MIFREIVIFFVKITIFFLLQLHLRTPAPHPRNGIPTKCWWTLQSIEVCVLWIFRENENVFRESEEFFVKLKNFAWNLWRNTVWKFMDFSAIQNFTWNRFGRNRKKNSDSFGESKTLKMVNFRNSYKLSILTWMTFFSFFSFAIHMQNDFT